MSVETIERLTTIIDGLTPIGDAGPGEPVLANEWNTMVGAVAELARIAVAREQTAEELLAAKFSRIEHEHRGQLDMGWFGPETRAFLEGQRNNRTDLASELARTRRDLDGAIKQLGDLRLQLDAVKNQIDDVDDRDRDRSKGINQLADRIEILGDNTTSIADLRTTFGGIDGRVGEALALREELIDDQGNRIDLAQLRADANVALQLRDNLTTADGQVAQYRDFERRLIAIEDAPTRPGDGGPFDPTDLRAELFTELALATEPRFAALEGNVGGFELRFEGLANELQIAQSATSSHATSIEALQNSVGTVPELTVRMNGVEGRVNSHETQITRLNPVLGRVSIAEERLGALDELDARLGAVTDDLGRATARIARLDGLEPRLVGLEALNLGDVVARVSGVEATALRAERIAAGNLEQIETLGAVSDEGRVQIRQLEVLAAANRQTLTLMSRDVSDIRTRFGTQLDRTDIIRPSGGGSFGPIV